MHKQTRAFLLCSSMLIGAIAPLAAQGPNLRLGLSQPAPVSPSGWSDSHTLQSVAPNQWKHGAVIGGAVGAGVGLVLYAIRRSVDEGSTSPFVIIGPILIGALIGGMIGSGSHE